MHKSYKYRLFPTKEQEVLLNKHFGCIRFVYNWGLSAKIKAYQVDKVNLNKYALSAQLPTMKKQEETAWLSEVIAQSLQAKLEDLDSAFVAFWKKTAEFPKFKSKKDRQSFKVPQRTRINFENGTVWLPKFKEIKFDNHRKFEGKICSSTISKSKTGKYFISILVEDGKELPLLPEIKEETALGIDLGIKNFATLSDGTKIANPRQLKRNLKALRKQSAILSGKKKGSNNREKQRIKVAKIYEKVTNARKDFQHKLTHKLTHDNQVHTLIVEDLDIAGMLKQRKFARHIQDCSWGQFLQFLEYKCKWYGKNFIQIGRFEPSSKLCTCGQINHELQLSERNWTCKSCHASHDRDILASQNIKRIGLEQPKFKLVEICSSKSMKQEITA